MTAKRYDRAYFDRWYRSPGRRAEAAADLERHVALAVALTESLLARPITSVLDVGAGEGRWQPILARLRPDASYFGVAPSEWPVAHWGRRRKLIRGDLLSIADLGIGGPFDLVVVADVLHYLPTATLRRGLLGVAPFVDGMLYAPCFTVEDAVAGDLVDLQPRRAATYREAFEDAGLRQIGPWSWTSRGRHQEMAALERTSSVA